MCTYEHKPDDKILEPLGSSYAIIAIDKDNSRVFYAVDSMSGQPYWTKYHNFAETWNEINPVTQVLSTLHPQLEEVATEIKVGIVTTTLDAKDIDHPLIKAQRKKAALKKLTKEDREILGV